MSKRRTLFLSPYPLYFNELQSYLPPFYFLTNALKKPYIRKQPAYLGRDTHVSRASSVRITPEIRAEHARDTLVIIIL